VNKNAYVLNAGQGKLQSLSMNMDFTFKNYLDVSTWFQEGSNVEAVALALSKESCNDQRRLRNTHWKDPNCIWGKVSLTLFKKNEVLLRYFLFDTWNRDLRHIKVNCV